MYRHQQTKQVFFCGIKHCVTNGFPEVIITFEKTLSESLVVGRKITLLHMQSNPLLYYQEELQKLWQTKFSNEISKVLDEKICGHS